MAQPGSIGSNSVSAIQQKTHQLVEETHQRATSAPTGASFIALNNIALNNVVPINSRPSPQIQSTPDQAMRTPSQNSWSSWGQGIGELLYTAAAFPFNFVLAAPSATSLGMRGTKYLATAAGQTTASTAMSLLENSKPMIDTLIKLSQFDEGKELLASAQNLAASLPTIAQNIHQMFSDNPELGQSILSTLKNLSRTTQNVSAHVQPTPQDLQNILTIINTLSDGINGSHLTQAAPSADDDGDVFYDTHSAISSMIEQISHISPAQVTNLIDGTLQKAPTEIERLVGIIAAAEGNIGQINSRLAAHITNTSINNFSSSELDTIAQSIVHKFHAAIGDIPNDDKLRLMHALLKNDPFGHIMTPIIRRTIGWPPAEPVAAVTTADTSAATAEASTSNPAVPTPVTFAQKVRRFFAPVTHAVVVFGQGCLGVIQRFIALLTPQQH